MKGILAILCVSLLGASPLRAQLEEAAIREVILEAYVNGAYNEGILRNMELGFSPDFESISLENGNTKVLTLQEWMQQVKQQQGKGRFPLQKSDRVSVHYHRIDINGNQANVKLNRMVGGKPVAVEYLDLYKHPGGWLIVNKTFSDISTYSD